MTLTSPNGGENWSGTGKYTATWSGSDPDGDELFYALEYSADDGATWFPIGVDLTENHKEIDLTNLPGGSSIKLRVSATDGANTTYDTSDSTFTVGKKSPNVFIFPLENGNTVKPNTPFYIQGYASDLEDGTLLNSQTNWESNIDGDLGSGNLLLTSLTPGMHEIAFSAEDSDQNIGSDTISIFAGYQSFIPFLVKR